MIESDPTTSQAHLDPAEVAGYVGGTISGDARRRVERHLADCEMCTEEVAGITRLARPTGSPRWLPYAAAAAVLAGLIVFWPRSGARIGDDTLRDGGPAAAVTVVEPADGAVVAGPPTLVWRAVPRAVIYRVLVTGSDGDSLWAVHTSDTTVLLPPVGGASAATVRHWYVDALLADGSSLSSGMRSYQARP
jgi:anti-sigma factor RsiW